MSEEFKEEEKKEEDHKKEEEEQNEDEQQEEGEQDDEQDDYADGENVPSQKYNQERRKRLEAEAKLRELSKGSDQEQGDEDDDQEEKELTAEQKRIAEIEKKISQRETNDRANARKSFFDKHPEYLNDTTKWQEILDEIDNSFNPNTTDDYFTQLEKAHRIVAGDEIVNSQIANKQREMANDAASSGDGARSGDGEDEFTAEDRAYMKEWNISEEGMRAAKEKLARGDMQIL